MFAWLSQGCSTCQPMVFNRYSYLFFSGVLGGTLFGLKYLYKVVARGWWNEDRELWRFFSPRSEEHTSELQSLMRISYAVFCLKKKTTSKNIHHTLSETQDLKN